MPTCPLLGQAALSCEERAEIRAVDVAHGDVEHSVGVAGLVDGNDVRVLELRGTAPLLLESLPEALVGRELGSEDLEGDLPVVPDLVREVDDAHPAPAELPLDAEPRKLRADAWIVGLAHPRIVAGIPVSEQRMRRCLP